MAFPCASLGKRSFRILSTRSLVNPPGPCAAARYTCAMPPLPSSARTRYLPTRDAGRRESSTLPTSRHRRPSAEPGRDLLRHRVDGEAELLGQNLVGRAGAVVIDPHGEAV